MSLINAPKSVQLSKHPEPKTRLIEIESFYKKLALSSTPKSCLLPPIRLHTLHLLILRHKRLLPSVWPHPCHPRSLYLIGFKVRNMLPPSNLPRLTAAFYEMYDLCNKCNTEQRPSCVRRNSSSRPYQTTPSTASVTRGRRHNVRYVFPVAEHQGSSMNPIMWTHIKISLLSAYRERWSGTLPGKTPSF